MKKTKRKRDRSTLVSIPSTPLELKLLERVKEIRRRQQEGTIDMDAVPAEVEMVPGIEVVGDDADPELIRLLDRAIEKKERKRAEAEKAAREQAK